MHINNTTLQDGFQRASRSLKTTASTIRSLHSTLVHLAGAAEIPRAGRCHDSLQHAAAAEIVSTSDVHVPPDVMPHVFLALEPAWSSSSSSRGVSQHNAAPKRAHKQQQQQQQESCVLPKTSVRLQGMQLPGFIPRLTAREDPQLTLWKQQSALAWHTAALWAQQMQRWLQQQQRQQTGHVQQQPQPAGHAAGGLQPQPSEGAWLQQLLTASSNHWGPAAAVLDAAGPWLQLEHLLLVTQTLAEVVARGSSGSSGGVGIESHESEVDLFKPGVLAVEPDLQYRPVRAAQSSSNAKSSRASSSVRLLKSCTILPQVSNFLLQQMQKSQGQQPQEGQQTSSTTAPSSSEHGSSRPSKEAVVDAEGLTGSSALDSASAVHLLQQLAQLHTTGKLGAVDAAVVAELVFHRVSLLQCSLPDLATLIHSCGQLGHPFRASWLATFIQEALDRLQGEQQQQHQQQQGAGVMASAASALLDGLSMYPGPHIKRHQLQPLLAALHHHLHSLTPLQLHQLLTAVASLDIRPSEAWLEAAAAAAQQQFADSSFQQLVLMLQGLTAHVTQPGGWSIQATWWQAWFESTASRSAAVSLAASASAAAGERRMHTSSGLAAATSGAGRAVHAAADSSPAVSESPGPSNWGVDVMDNSEFVVSEPHQQDVVSAEVVFDALLVLLRVQQPVHPLWLAGTLEAYHRSGYTVSSTPQLLLLVSDLLDNPPAFAVRHRALMNQLIQPMAQNLAELNPEQLTQAVEVCAVYTLSPGVDWFRWHSAAIMRLNTTFPLQLLARAAEAYQQLQQVPDDYRLQQLFKSIPWRLNRQERRQKAQQRLGELRATITFKNEQRRRQNMRDREELEKKKMKWQQRDARKWGVGGSGIPAAAAAEGGAGPEGKQQWRRRKLKPPGTLDRKF